MGTIRLVMDGPGQNAPAEVAPERLPQLLADPDHRVWLDITDPGPEAVALLRQAFGFHELALAEVTEPHERPRCDTYTDYYFIVVYAAELQGREFHPRELNLFWGKNYLVTIHRRPQAVVAVLDDTRKRWEQHDGRQTYGIACLVHTLFERIVDGYFLVQDRFRERMESIEESILEGGDTAAADLYRLRKDLLRVPRLLAPTTHVLAEVLRRERGIPAELRPYFGDVQDHASHVLAEMDTYRDLLGAALDVNVFYSFNRLGHIMKRLTAVTVIIMVPNFVASIYGMNFDNLYPPSAGQWSFFIVAASLMVMVAWGFIHSKLLKWL